MSKWPMKEAEFQVAVINLAETLKWRVFHCGRSDLSTRNWTARGFPDLVLARDCKVIFAELKSEDGRLAIDQKKWGKILPNWHLWRPSDWDEIQAILSEDATEPRQVVKFDPVVNLAPVIKCNEELVAERDAARAENEKLKSKMKELVETTRDMWR